MTESSDPMINTLVAGRFRVLRLLGEGGMGQVYLAEHEAIEKKVALKVLRPEYSTKPEIVLRFQQEAISASRIKHPNVLDVFDFGRLDNGCFFLAMEFLEGNDLADELVRQRTLDPERGVKIALQICRALGAAHARGVVHRDLKPENVFIQRTGDGEEIVKIVDFGIAQLRSPEEAAQSEPKRRRLTRTGMIFGTPEYMAPEQAGGKNADFRVDVYALGVILYEMFTGAVPFTGETFLQVLSAHLNNTAPPMSAVCPDLRASPELQAAIMKALAKDPNDRHTSMVEFSAAILRSPEGRAAGGTGLRLSAPEFATTQAAAAPGSGSNPTAAQFGADVAARASYAGPQQAPAAGGGTLAHGSPGTHASAQTAAPTETQVSGDTRAGTVPRPASPWPAILIVGGFGVLAGGGALAWFATRAPNEPGASAEPTTVTSSEPRPAENTLASAAVTPPVAPSAPGSTEVVPASGVRLSVETEPAGAVLLKDGFQVCDSTPCEVTANSNETLELEARRGPLRGTAKVLAQKDQRVKISLVGGAAPGKKPPGKPRLCERFDENLGIKIMTPCE
jgi:serine/threonine-protein kinase